MFNYSLNFNLIAIISDTFWKIKQLTLNRLFHFFRVRLRKKLFGAHCFITFFSLYVSECKIYTTILLRKKQGAFHDAPCFCLDLMFNYSLNFNLIAIISDTFWKIKQLTLIRLFHFFRVRLRKKLFGAHCFITFFSLYVSECKIYTTILLRKKQGAFHDAPCFCFN